MHVSRPASDYRLPMNDDYPSMNAPAIYRIRIKGHLDPVWADRLENMNIENLQSSGGKKETVLEGRLEDQSALAGVLATLYELHLPVISADCLGSANGE